MGMPVPIIPSTLPPVMMPPVMPPIAPPVMPAVHPFFPPVDPSTTDCSPESSGSCNDFSVFSGAVASDFEDSPFVINGSFSEMLVCEEDEEPSEDDAERGDH